MLHQAIPEFFERDLLNLKAEISAYPDEASLWTVREGISNSGGNLCLHLIGNLNHFIGATLGHSGYVRERDREFTDKHVPRSELLAAIDQTSAIVKATLDKLDAESMEREFPLEKHGQKINTGHMLLHLLAHLGYHLGQINYHRRLA